MSDENTQIVIGLIFLLVNAVLAVAMYIVFCTVLWRLGKKFQDEDFLAYCVPIYNLILLCRCAGVSAWHTALLFLPFVNVGATIWIWGNIARRMGKNFWLYGLGVLLFIPMLVLAFGTAKPLSDKPSAAHDVRQRVVPKRYLLSCVHGEIAGSRMEIPVDSLVIGRNPQYAQVILSHPHVSSRHARIWMEPMPGGSRIWLTDLHSMNGTLYRREPEQGWTPLQGGETLLQDGDMIRIADGIAEFRVIVETLT